jgi:pimeloyl-ACP methyl ester carboxylesterase
MTFAVVFAALVFYVWLQAYFLFGEDLVIDLSANQTSFRITNQQSATVEATLRADKQLSCTTLCTIGLTDGAGAQQHAENLTIRAGESITRAFTLLPNAKGSGQVIYSLTAKCANQPSFFCPSPALSQQDTVLLLVNYELPQDVNAVKERLALSLPEYLTLLQETDTLLLTSNAQLVEEPRLHPGQLLGSMTSLSARFVALKVPVENALAQWSDEEYPLAQETLANASIGNTTLLALRDDATVLSRAIAKLPATHDALRARLDVVRETLRDLIADYGALAYDRYAERALLDTVASVNTTVSLYNTDGFLRYSDLAQRIGNLENSTLDLGITLAQRNHTVTLQGQSLWTARNADACAANLSLSCNTTLSPPGNIPALCDALLTPPWNASNITLSNTTLSNASLPNATITVMIDDFTTLYCGRARNLALDASPLLPAPVLPVVNVTSAINTTLSEAMPQCCVFGECRACCTTAACAADPATYPVVFVHGHAFNSYNSPEYSLGGYFAGIQRALQQDGYLDAGIVTPSSTISETGAGEWGLSGRPVTARVTYYYNFYRSGDDYILIAQKSENIETYALRLNEMISIIKHNTGKERVNIVAHSMGGLVVRRYLQLFGEGSVDKVVLIGAPDNGTAGRVLSLCPVFGESKECADMAADSVFMRKLNDPESQPKSVRFYTIAGTGCDVNGQDGDGVVQAASVALPYATNYQVNGTCPDFLGTKLHTELLNIEKYPQVYDIIKTALKS